MGRAIRHQYQDPLELVWLRCAAELGMRVERSGEVYASWDGKDTLTLSDADDFDADDSLAQLIFHEICHGLVAGPRGKRLPDWGLSNTDNRDLVFEHACHRVQAALAAPHGLRAFFAVTTEWRPYWDALPEQPLAEGDDPAIPLALEAYRRAELDPLRTILQTALKRTAQLAVVARECAQDTDSLWLTVRPRHPTGMLMGTGGDCGSCAWSYGGRVKRCRRSHQQAKARSIVRAEWPGCEAYEPTFSETECRSCAACCRQGYDVVQLRRGDRVAQLHPELVREQAGVRVIPRPEGRCLALSGEEGKTPFSCEVYAVRPRSCAELEVRGDACLWARRRVGLTR